MSGPLTLNGDPAGDLQAATKQYVDAASPKFATGTWTGDDTPEREIQLPFAADLVQIHLVTFGTGPTVQWNLAAEAATTKHYEQVQASSFAHDTLTASSFPRLIEGGTKIEVNNSNPDQANEDGVTYRWFAWGESD